MHTSVFKPYGAFPEYRTFDEVQEKDKWLADNVALLVEEEIAELRDDPQHAMLSPVHVNVILEHLLLFHKARILLVSTMHSVDFANNQQSVGVQPDLPRADWKHRVAAAMPLLTDDKVFGAMESFDVVLIPVYVPGHFVRCPTLWPMRPNNLGTRDLRR
jgi:hypothetical protein